MRIAYIDLTTSRTEVKDIPQRLRELFLGGRGINIYLLYNDLTPEIAPLDPKNPLIIGAGLLTGIPGPSTARCSISGKSPETGLLGDSNIGGYFGPELRKAGFDHILVRGQSKKPIYIFIKDGDIRINDAKHLWGKDTMETMDILNEEHGDSAQVLTIGQAGENLVRFACIRHGYKSTAGRTGLGCLMGSKKLKAIVVKGSSNIPVSQLEKWRQYNRSLQRKIVASNVGKILAKYGTPFLYDLHNRWGIIRTHGGQLNQFPEGRNLRSTLLQKKYYRERKGCFSCPIRCRHRYLVPAGPNKALWAEGPEYGTLGAFGPICGIKNLEAILVINDLLNRYGLDSTSTGNIIAWAIKLFKHGLIDKSKTAGLELDWGREEVIIELIHQIATRSDFGNLLADGALSASKKFGEGTEEYLFWVKNLPQSDPVDVRVHKGFALGVATSTRGADHLRSRPTLEALGLEEDLLKKIYGGPVSSDSTSYQGKARMVWWTESLYAVADSLGICKFVIKFNSPDLLGFEEFSHLIDYATGMRFSSQELFDIGRRIINLERLFLTREGIRRSDDTLPKGYFQPMPVGPYKGERIEEESFQRMLSEYYQLHGWDIDTGIPKEETLRELDLNREPSRLL